MYQNSDSMLYRETKNMLPEGDIKGKVKGFFKFKELCSIYISIYFSSHAIMNNAWFNSFKLSSAC